MSQPLGQTSPPTDQYVPPTVETRTVPGPDAPSIGALFSRVSEQMSRLVRDEVKLAQMQLAEKGKRLGVGAALFAVAGVLALYAFGVLLAAAVLGLAEALPAWLAALIVGVVLLLVAGVAAFVGKRRLDASRQFEVKPQEGLKKDVEAVRKGIQR